MLRSPAVRLARAALAHVVNVRVSRSSARGWGSAEISLLSGLLRVELGRADSAGGGDVEGGQADLAVSAPSAAPAEPPAALKARFAARRASGGEVRGGQRGGALASSVESFKSGLASYASLEAEALPPAAPNGGALSVAGKGWSSPACCAAAKGPGVQALAEGGCASLHSNVASCGPAAAGELSPAGGGEGHSVAQAPRQALAAPVSPMPLPPSPARVLRETTRANHQKPIFGVFGRGPAAAALAAKSVAPVEGAARILAAATLQSPGEPSPELARFKRLVARGPLREMPPEPLMATEVDLGDASSASGGSGSGRRSGPREQPWR
ncbi:hypothetical protein WJX81_001773 [Elliptochloris bilobata]|uniref:Uncharacterized protein n=1 Tax=Elliptochloris bilobata TaxID=381761 RepID=A0AAW1RJZ4_9CHLO